MTPRRVKDVSFGAFLKLFHSGKTVYGDYFNHLIPWYEIRNQPNVLFITYEQLKKNTGEVVLKIADFLGDEHGRALREDKQFYEKVLQSSCLGNMKKIFDYTPVERVKALGELPPSKLLISLESFKGLRVDKNEMHEGTTFVRKGHIGEWRTHYTAEFFTTTKAWIAQKTKGCDVMNLWKDLDLP
ncbi:sulfotransferase ssu-1-like [Rhipicephalus sanguineus]|uniref:sulfotransferase ssu-1-like n=1 Tax=Rhipicephalus sanguineus TaxID=34632 RepID=UPI001893552A|nr:sulfotransferase ssu-1-like [Rhipicephalus sanguineus]